MKIKQREVKEINLPKKKFVTQHKSNKNQKRLTLLRKASLGQLVND